MRSMAFSVHSESELWHLYSIVQRQIRLLHLSVHKTIAVINAIKPNITFFIVVFVFYPN